MSTSTTRNHPPAPDVLVVGAGPAGLATAIGLRQRGLSVRILEGRPMPSADDDGLDKACGEGLMPDGAECLRQLGVFPERLRHGVFRGIRWIEGELEIDGAFPGLPGRGIRRTELHRALVERALEAGVDIRWSTRVTALQADDDRPRVETAEGPVEARWLVGADGLRSKVRRWLDLDGRGDPAATARFGVRRHYAVAPWSDRVEVYWSDAAEAYVTPVAENSVGVAILWSGRKGGFDDHLVEFPGLRRRLEGLEVRSEDRGSGPLRQRTRGVVRGSCALVGDAAGYVDAITGEGLSISFHQARALVDALAAGDLGPYPARRRAIDRTPRLLTELLLFLERRPKLRRRVFRALAAQPGLFERFLAVHVRAVAPHRLLPQVPRMAWHILRAG